MEVLEQQVTSLVGDVWLGRLITAALVIAATAVIAHLVAKFLRKVLNYSEDLPSSSIFVNIARAAIWVLGVCMVLSTCFNVDVSAAIAALGVGGIALSLGFQDTISNLIGGVQVSLLGIVAPGDNIEVGASRGVVKDVTWHHTTITNSKGEEVIIPNSIINKTALVHLPPANQVSVPVSVSVSAADLDATAHAIEQAAREAAGGVGAVEKEPAVSFSEVGDMGYRGTIIFRMVDAADTVRAADAVVRAVAPIAR